MATMLSWDGPAELARAYREACERATPFTLGVEEELILVDAETLQPIPAIEEVIAAVDGDGRYATELRSCQIEIITPVCTTPGEIAGELAWARCGLIERIDTGILLAGVAAHPTATGPAQVTDRPRYHEIVERCGWSALRGIASGLHVHVAVGGAERTLAVFNALRSYLPEVAALAANSPFSGGVDTGFASVRAKLNETLPQSGLPPRLDSWEMLAEFVAWGRAGRILADSSHLWWDMRPHPAHGTIEVRIADVQTSVEHAAGIAALCHALAAELALRFEAGESLPEHDDLRIRTNLWQAQRFGLDAVMLDLVSGEPGGARSRIADLLARLRPVAARLGCEQDLDLAWAVLVEGGAERQRRLAESHGVDGLVRRIAEETHHSAYRNVLGVTAV